MRSAPSLGSVRTWLLLSHRPLAAVVLLLLLTVQSRAQTVIYVNAAAAPGGDGQSWATAYNDLQSALTRAALIPEAARDVEVWVAEGVYRPSARRDPQDPLTVSFSLLNRTRLLGGFSGSEIQSWERNWVIRTTVLSGDLLGNDGPFSAGFANYDDNCYSVVYANLVNEGSVLDGFLITGGNLGQGGGVSSWRSSHQVRNCTIYRNRAIYGGGWNGTPGSVSFENCWFHANHAVTAGGAMMTDNSIPLGPGQVRGLTVTGCTFTRNTAGVQSVLQLNNWPFSMANCTIAFNSGGNAALSGGPAFAIRNSIIWQNPSPSGEQVSSSFAVSVIDSIVSDPASSIRCAPTTLVRVLETDPVFSEPFGPDFAPGTLDDDFRLSASSPAIDRGDNAAWTSPLLFDVNKRRRFSDGNQDGQRTIDLGSAEYGSPLFTPRLYVRRSANVGGDGATWATAFGSEGGLTDAIALAQSYPGGYSEIWVAAGTYKPAGFAGSRAATFQLQNNLAIYGGFTGTETALSERPPRPLDTGDALDPSRSTILSGDLNGDDNGDINLADNSYHVLTAAGVASTAIDGVTVTGGQADGPGTSGGRGGGLHAESSDLVVRGCWFTLNRAPDTGNGNAGGAISLDPGGTSQIIDCTFDRNPARGAAVYVNLGGPHVFRRCRFVENDCEWSYAGAVMIEPVPFTPSWADAAFVDCDFVRNRVRGAGGGAGAVWGGGRPLRFVRCRFHGNVGWGVGAVSVNGDISVESCEFVGNVGGLDGGQFGHAPALLINSPGATIANSAFINNVAGGGYGAFHNSTGGLPPFLRNCLFRGNRAGAAGVFAAQISGTDTSAVATLSYSSVEGWTGQLGGQGPGNDGLDPLFVREPSAGLDGLWGTSDDNYGDLRTLPGSPAVDSADSTAVPIDRFDLDDDGNTTEALPLDLGGNPRFVNDPGAANTGPGNPPHVDRGPYERQVNCATCPGPREWQSLPGGAWDDPTNWTPSVPDETHATIFDIDAAYGVFFDAPPSGLGTRSIQSLTVSDGSVTLDLNQTTLSATTTQLPSLVVGNTAADSAALTITDGTLNIVSGRVASVATAPGVTDALNVGAGGRLIASRTLTVGAEGRGVMNVSSGGRVTSRDATIGDQPGSSGYVSVTGAGSSWDIPFFLIIDNGELNVSSQGAVTVGTGIPFTGVFLLNEGRVSGDGTINGNLVNFGRLTPGNSPGTLTINGGYAQVGAIQDLGAFSGRLDMEIAPPLPGQSAPRFDRLIVNNPGIGSPTGGSGDMALGGGLFVNFLEGFQPSPADSFNLLAATGAVTSQFDVIFFPALTAAPVQNKFLRASYSNLRGPGGGGVTVSVADLPVNAGFQNPQEVPLAGRPSAAAIGDLDRDGDLDLAIALPAPGGNGGAPGSVAVLFNNGAGGFGGVVQIPAAVNPQALAIADIDGVQGNDLVIANAGSDNVRIVRQQGLPGSFADPSPYVIQLAAGSEPVAVAARDLDPEQDAFDRPDIVTANAGGSSDTGSISISRNTGTPGLPTRSIPMPPRQKPGSIVPFSPDQDKDLDIATTTSNSAGTEGSLTTFTNVGGIGLFVGGDPSPPVTSFGVGANPVEAAAGVLGPGGAAGGPSGAVNEDVVTVNFTGQSVSVLRNTTVMDDQISFAPAVEYAVESGAAGVSSDPRSIALADLDNDGDYDLAALASTSPVQRVIKVLRNDSTIQTLPGNVQVRQVAFAPLADRPSGDCPEQVLSGDVSGDGRRDLVTVNAACGRGVDPGSVAVNRNTLPPVGASVGACCVPGGTGGCVLVTIGECVNALGGTYQGDLTACGPANPCPYGPTACCRGSTCAVVTLSTLCAGPNARPAGAGTACNAAGNVNSPCCLADFNRSGATSVQDIFDFLASYFTGSGYADINRSGGTSVQDIFDFLAAYFAGCN